MADAVDEEASSPAASRRPLQEPLLDEGVVTGSSEGTGVPMTSWVMLGDMLGLGALALPSVFARLGWLPASVLLAACALGALYSGRLFTAMAQQVPDVKVFDDFGGRAMGRAGRRLVYATIYAAILLNPVLLHLTSAEALEHSLPEARFHRTFAPIVVACLMAPLSQVRKLHDISTASVLGTLAMVWALLVTAVQLCGRNVTEHPKTHIVAPVTKDKVSQIFVAVLDAVFAFGGQENWVRFLMGMKATRDFPKAVVYVIAFMTVCYYLFGGVGYVRLGTQFEFDRPVTSILPANLWSSLANAGLLAHCIIAYMININIWTQLVLHVIAPQYDSGALGMSHAKGRGAWALVSLAGIAVSCLGAILLPYFDILAAIMGALGNLVAAYALPALFVLKLMGDTLPKWERTLCKVIIPVSVLLSIIGIIFSITALVQREEEL